MFEGSLVESCHLLQTNNRWTTTISLLLQTSLAALIVGLPLLHPEVIPIRVPRLTMLEAPIRPVPVKPVQAASEASSTTASHSFAPPLHPLPLIDVMANPEQPLGNIAPVMVADNNVPGALLATGTGSHPAVVAEPVKKDPPKTLRVSAGVAQGLLLAPLHPVYPQIAIVTRTEGTVVVQAVISKVGTVESLHVLSGPPMLQNAALEAIRAARYTPYRLDGDPVEVETTFTVTFRMGS